MRLAGPSTGKFSWFINNEQIKEDSSYKYLGIVLRRGMSFNTQKGIIMAKAQTLTFAYKLLKQKLNCPSFSHLLKVMSSQLLPTLAYGLEIWHGRESETLNKLQTRVYKAVFNLPKCTSPAQIRLEFGLQNQVFYRQSVFVKLCWKFRSSSPGTLNHQCWLEIKAQFESNKLHGWGKHLRLELESLDMQEAWDSKMERAAFNKVCNRSAKIMSLLRDKNLLAKRNHSWTVINSYVNLKPQAYLAYWMGGSSIILVCRGVMFLTQIDKLLRIEVNAKLIRFYISNILCNLL